MIGYVVRRIGQTILVLFGVSLIAFGLRALLPNIARSYDPHATPAQIKSIDVTLGLNHPFWYQYWKFVDNLLHGNLGFSYKYNQPVNSIFQHEVMRDVVLLGISLVLSVLLAIPVGLLQAKFRNTFGDIIGTVIAFFFFALPDFVLAILLVALFADHFHWFQPTAPNLGILQVMKDFFPGLALPIIAETITAYAAYARFMRSAAVDSLTQDYIRTARAKGLAEGQVVRRHVIRNSLIPMATLIGLSIPAVLTSGLFIENVSNFQGIGYQAVQSAQNGDYPTVEAITVIIAAITVIGNLVADLAYGVLDPRIRY